MAEVPDYFKLNFDVMTFVGNIFAGNGFVHAFEYRF